MNKWEYEKIKFHAFSPLALIGYVIIFTLYLSLHLGGSALAIQGKILGSTSTPYRQYKYSLPCFKCKHSFISHLLWYCRTSETILILSFHLSLSLPNIFFLQIIPTKTVLHRSPQVMLHGYPSVIIFIYVYGSVHRWSILIIIQQDATQSSLFIILQVHSTCFGCQPHPSSGVHKTVTTASSTGHIFCAAT